MKPFLILAAFALGLAGIAAPATAQTVPAAGQTLTPETQALADALANSVGGTDRIFFYAEVGPDLSAEDAAHFMTRFAPRGMSLVRIFGGKPDDIVKAFVAMVIAERQAGKTWARMSLVIDHGKVSVALTEPGAMPAGSFETRLEAETARVFPGLTVEPFKGYDTN
jgi:hypothetical protein